MSIKLLRDEKDTAPQAICPHCKKTMMVDITPFQKDITKPMQSNCVHCGGVIFTSLLIFMETDLMRLYKVIAAIVQMTSPANQKLMG